MNHIDIWCSELCGPLAQSLPANINFLSGDDLWFVNEEIDDRYIEPDLQPCHEGQVFEYPVELAAYFHSLPTNESRQCETESPAWGNRDRSMFADAIGPRASWLRLLLPRRICNHQSQTQTQRTDKQSPLAILIYRTVLEQVAKQLAEAW